MITRREGEEEMQCVMADSFSSLPKRVLRQTKETLWVQQEGEPNWWVWSVDEVSIEKEGEERKPLRGSGESVQD